MERDASVLRDVADATYLLVGDVSGVAAAGPTVCMEIILVVS